MAKVNKKTGVAGVRNMKGGKKKKLGTTKAKKSAAKRGPSATGKRSGQGSSSQ